MATRNNPRRLQVDYDADGNVVSMDVNDWLDLESGAYNIELWRSWPVADINAGLAAALANLTSQILAQLDQDYPLT